MIAVWVLVSNSSGLRHRGIWVYAADSADATILHVSLAILAVVALAGYEQYSLMEAAYDRDLWWLLWLLLWLSLLLRLHLVLASLILW